jgi:hypothetical protein
MDFPKSKFRCMQCEMGELQCSCEKYCSSCQSQIDARLCEDGLFYCSACREACGYKTDIVAGTR